MPEGRTLTCDPGQGLVSPQGGITITSAEIDPLLYVRIDVLLYVHIDVLYARA
jgi:hypothetical protein